MEYERLTLTERAEAHILAARQLMGAGHQNLHQLGGLLAPGREQANALIAAAGAQFAAAQAEAALANACALLAANQGPMTVPVE